MNTIYSLIHKNLKQMLAVSLGAAGAVLAIYIFFSFKQTEVQAVRFVTNHVAALAQAGVNSQNVNEIDKEIGRFTQTWKETQDLDLRVDIFLDEKLVSHAGQLQPFQNFYSRAEEKILLPSGQVLRIKVEIDLHSFFLSGTLLLLCIAVFIFGMFYVLMKSMQRSIKSVTSPLETRIEWLKAIAKDLPASAHQSHPPTATAQILEIDELGASIGTLLKQIVMLEGHVMEAGMDRGRISAAEQFAHSIKGVIGTLQLKIGSIPELSDRQRREINECVNSLRDISLDLLRLRKKDAGMLPPKSAPTSEALHLLPALNAVLTAKRTQYSSRAGIRIAELNEANLFGSFCNLTSVDLQTIFASLIDNAVEAIEQAGTVVIEATRSEEAIVIQIKDDGKGISEKILPLLMKEGATFGKDEGNGIGLFHAKTLLGRVGGEITLSSVEGKGTTSQVSIPLVSPPRGFTKAIEVPTGVDLIIVDDDPLVHQLWRHRLKASDLKRNKLVHLSSASEFEEWLEVHERGELGQRLYLFDFDLKVESSNGLDLIERHGLTFESVLISGVADDSSVKDRATRLGVNWLSKDFLGTVPIFSLGGSLEKASFLGA